MQIVVVREYVRMCLRVLPRHVRCGPPYSPRPKPWHTILSTCGHISKHQVALRCLWPFIVHVSDIAVAWQRALQQTALC